MNSSASQSPTPAPEDGPVLPRPARHRGRFANPGRHDDRGWLDVLRWKLGSRAPAWSPAPPVTPRPAPPAPAAGIAATWVGHATFLVQTPSLTLLTDPHWSERAGLFGLVGPRRAQAPGIRFDSLPPLDAILLSHDHYDHWDTPTLRRLASAHPRARLYCPFGYESLAARAGFGGRTRCHDWWEEHPLGAGVTLTATPARHWSNRLSGARNARLWCGWHLATPTGGVFFAGDTAWDEAMFPAIRQRLGAPRLALLPIGAYAPRWFLREQHCDPEEAVRIHRALGAERSVAMHWGTFSLTDEPREEPPRLLRDALAAAALPADEFVAIEPGETVAIRPAK